MDMPSFIGLMGVFALIAGWIRYDIGKLHDRIDNLRTGLRADLKGDIKEAIEEAFKNLPDHKSTPV